MASFLPKMLKRLPIPEREPGLEMFYQFGYEMCIEIVGNNKYFTCAFPSIGSTHMVEHMEIPMWALPCILKAID